MICLRYYNLEEIHFKVWLSGYFSSTLKLEWKYFFSSIHAMSRAFVILRSDLVTILHREKSRQESRVGFISENIGFCAQISSSDNPLSRVCALSRVLHTHYYPYLNTIACISISICILIAFLLVQKVYRIKMRSSSKRLKFWLFFFCLLLKLIPPSPVFPIFQ